MSSSAPENIFVEIQRDIIGDKVSLSAVLRKARLVAKKLKLSEFEAWLTLEMDGYAEKSGSEYPSYRKVPGSPNFFNPFHGWCPIMIKDETAYELYHTVLLSSPIEELEKLSKEEDVLTFTYPHRLTSLLSKSIDHQFRISALVNPHALSAPVNKVKDTVLEWAIDLEQAGVKGVNLSFSSEDRVEAKTITQNVYAQNIGNLGDVAGNSLVGNAITADNFSAGDIHKHANAIREAVPGLPENIQPSVVEKLAKLELEPQNAETIFSSIRSICEGVTSNIAAQGIVQFINSILG